MEEQLKTLISKLDEQLVKTLFNAKLNGYDNAWVYQQIKKEIFKQPNEVQRMLLSWLDNRLGEYKLF